MKKETEKILCETPTPGKKPIFIDKWKYDLICNSIINILKNNSAGVSFKELPQLIEAQLTKEDLHNLGSVVWYTTTVKLDMEVKGIIKRLENVSPQKLTLNTVDL